MFDGLREEVDKARWKQNLRRWSKIAAQALAVKRRDVFLAFAPDGVGDLLVVYYKPTTRQYEIRCTRVNALTAKPIGDPLRFVSPQTDRRELGDSFAGIVAPGAPGAWMEHAQERAWEKVWGPDWPAEYRATYRAVESPDDEPEPSETPEPVERDIDYWPTLDVDAAWAEVSKTFHDVLAEQDKTQLYFPRWAVRRIVTLTLLEQVASIRPAVAEELAGLLGFDGINAPDPFREDPAMDEELDAFLVKSHLSQIVWGFMQGLSAEE
jgi:hypothetical protein